MSRLPRFTFFLALLALTGVIGAAIFIRFNKSEPNGAASPKITIEADALVLGGSLGGLSAAIDRLACYVAASLAFGGRPRFRVSSWSGSKNVPEIIR